MIMLNTVEARALLNIFEGKPLDGEGQKTTSALFKKLKDHEWLILQCEASVSRPAIQPKEPA